MCYLNVYNHVYLFLDLTKLEKTSSGEARDKTRCAINKVLIPRVTIKIIVCNK